MPNNVLEFIEAMMMNRRSFLALTTAATALGFSSNARALPPKRLIFVHGRSQHGLDPVGLKESWLQSLTTALAAKGLSLPADITVEFPYYGDVLDEFIRQAAVPLSSEVRSRGGPVQDEFLAFQAQVVDEILQPSGVTDAQVDAEYGPNPRPRGPLNWEWVQACLRALDMHGGGMSQGAIERFTRDVFLYVTSPVVRDAINEIVAASLDDQPTIVVGHSLGSVVAYNVLKTDPKSSNVPLLITVGSPLGIRAIRNPLRPLGFPRAVRSWYNAYDRRDVVALYPLDSANFAVQPPIENYSGIKNSTDNRHGIVGYLGDPTVAEKIYHAVAS